MALWHSHNASPSQPPLYFLSLSHSQTHTHPHTHMQSFCKATWKDTLLCPFSAWPLASTQSLKHEANPNFGKHWLCWKLPAMTKVHTQTCSLSLFFFIFFVSPLPLIPPAELWPTRHTHTHPHAPVCIELLNSEQQGHTLNTHQGRVIRHQEEPHVHASKHTHTHAC